MRPVGDTGWPSLQLPIVASSIVSLYFLELTDLFKPAKVGFQCYDRTLSMPYVETSEELIPLLMLLSLAFAAPAASVRDLWGLGEDAGKGPRHGLRPNAAPHSGRSWWARACSTACSRGSGAAAGARAGPRAASMRAAATSTPSCGAQCASWVSPAHRPPGLGSPCLPAPPTPALPSHPSGVHVFGLCATALVTDVIQLATGYHTPFFLTVCKPNYTMLGTSCEANPYITQDICSGHDAHAILSAR